MPCEYHTIHVKQVQSYQIQALSPDSFSEDKTNGLFTLGKLDTKALKAREQSAVRRVKERDAMKGKGVSKEAQDIFDALART
jgi:protein LSM12